jgi:serine/threonine protein kinase
MPAEQNTHPSEEILRQFALGKSVGESSATILSHLEQCATCREQVASLSGDSFLGRLRAAAGPGVTPVPDKLVGELPRETFMTSGVPVIPDLPAELANYSQYEVVKELGRGGMGVVYLARNRHLDRLEVLKVMGRGLLEQEGARQRFEREMRSAARLNHPNVVTAYSLLPLEGLLVFAMEYVPGDDLAKAVKARGPLPVANACYYAHQAALGLQHAHEQGMVHRDIKPQNLILARDRKRHVVKVLDFGLAKATSEKGGQYELTGEGKMLGTPQYMAPEQIDNAARADIRADVYSLGCTFYFLLSGKAPFAGDNLLAILHAHHAKEAAPLNEVRPDVPEALVAVVRKMMAKDPAQRYQTPGEVAQALVPFIKPGAATVTPAHAPGSAAVTTGVWDSLAESTPTPPSVRAAKARRRTSVTGVTAALLLAGLAWLSAGGLFKLKTAEGTIVVDINEPGAEVSVNGGKVNVSWENGGKTAVIHLQPGTYKVGVTKDGFTAYGETVALEDGGRQVLMATIEHRAPPKKQSLFLSQMRYLNSKYYADWFSTDGTVFGQKVSVDGKETPHGIFLHPENHDFSEVSYKLDRDWTTFRCDVAVPRMSRKDEERGLCLGGSLTFEVIGDDLVLWSSKPVHEFGVSQRCEVDVTGVDVLWLRVRCPGSAWCARSLWVEPQLSR